MQLKILISCLIALFCTVNHVQSQRICETLKARCRLCVRSISEGPNEDNIANRLNRLCREEVGNRLVWRELNRCDWAEIRCKALNRRLTCALAAELAKMQRRLL